MRPTRRGWGAVCLVLTAVLLAGLSGRRELNAIAAPVLAALLVAVFLVRRAETPTVERGSLRPGFPGDSRHHELRLDGSGVVAVHEDRPDELGGGAIDAIVTLPHTIDRPVSLASRGVAILGPPTVTQRDPLGLVERTVPVESTAEIVVYPRPYDVGDRRSLLGLLSDDTVAGDGEFDHLREYVPGDPLRRVHWKSSARHESLLVREFTPPRETAQVSIAADAVPGRVDEMASATATVTVAALDAGLSVALTLPDSHLPGDRGESHREAALELLASTDAGSVADAAHAEADVSVRARSGETTIQVGDRTTALEEMLVGGSPIEAHPEVNVP